MADFAVRGADDLQKLSKALKQAGQTELRKELHKAMKKAAKPLTTEAKAAARETFPKRGGLAAREGKIPFTARVVTGRTPGVKIAAPGRYVVGKTVNQTGRFRRPVFAQGSDRKEWAWVDQDVPGGEGWFDRRMEQQAPTVRPYLEQALEQMAQRVVREVGRR